MPICVAPFTFWAGILVHTFIHYIHISHTLCFQSIVDSSPYSLELSSGSSVGRGLGLYCIVLWLESCSEQLIPLGALLQSLFVHTKMMCLILFVWQCGDVPLANEFPHCAQRGFYCYNDDLSPKFPDSERVVNDSFCADVTPVYTCTLL